MFVRLVTDVGEGWGECVAPTEPGYTAEHAAGAARVLRDRLLPALLGTDVTVDGATAALVAVVDGHHMAKAAVELAVLDAALRATGESLAAWLGGERSRVEAGAAVGMAPSAAEVLEQVAAAVDAGYRRVKLKVAPGWDVEPVTAVRERFPELRLQVDANGAYQSGDADHRRALASLDRLGLLLIEQPLDAGDLAGHARLVEELATPVCLDESITSCEATARALDARACSVVCVKPGSVGGWVEARRIHDLCRERGVPAWCGGMHETSLGRSALVALASLPGFSLPGDLSAPSSYLVQDVVSEPLVVRAGWADVPAGPGAGATVDRSALDAVTVAREELRP